MAALLAVSACQGSLSHQRDRAQQQDLGAPDDLSAHAEQGLPSADGYQIRMDGGIPGTDLDRLPDYGGLPSIDQGAIPPPTDSAPPLADGGSPPAPDSGNAPPTDSGLPPLPDAAAPPPPPTGFPITLGVDEPFGVSHPDQLLEFALGQTLDPNTRYRVTVAGSEVPAQVSGPNRLLVRLEGGLAQHGQRQFIVHGPGGQDFAAHAAAVKLTDRGDSYEIDNGLLAVRVTKAATNYSAQPADANVIYQNPAIPAPIQGLRYPDGSWTASGATLLAWGPNEAWQNGLLNAPVSSMQVSVLERGPLRVKIQVRYNVVRPAFYGGLAAAGPGAYVSTIEVQAGQPSILIEEDAEMELAYTLNVGPGLNPNQGRYQGHMASGDRGRTESGAAYGPRHERPMQDAFVDLPFAGSGREVQPMNAGQEDRWVALWNPWIVNSGWYWMLYDKNASGSANLFGAFAGKASRLLGGQSGIVIYHQDGQHAGVKLTIARRGPDAYFAPRIRFHWGIYLGRKSDLRPGTAVQRINQQQNLHGGFNLNKQLKTELAYGDAPGGSEGIWLPRAKLRTLFDQLRQSGIGGTYHNYVRGKDPVHAALWDALADASRVPARADQILDETRKMTEAYINGFGIQDFLYLYWNAGSKMNVMAAEINALLIYDAFYGALDPTRRRRLKAALAHFGGMLWDNDFVPLFEGHHQNLGTANMPPAQLGYRRAVTLALRHHPLFAQRITDVRQKTLALLPNIVNEHGASIGTPHYGQASLMPNLNLLRQMQLAGIYDAFAAEPRLKKAARFWMQLSGPDPRFGAEIRKMRPSGDAPIIGFEGWAQMATAFASVDPALSRQLMWIWNKGRYHSGFWGPSFLRIDESLPSEQPNLGDELFAGHMGVLRDRFGTSSETAVWLINGTFYKDHSNCDYGAVLITAHGAPLSHQPGSLYSPHQPGAGIRNVLMSAAATGGAWANAPLADQCYGAPDLTWTAGTPTLAGLANGAKTSAQFSKDGVALTRTVYNYRLDGRYSVVRIRDSFTGGERVFSLNLLGNGTLPQGQLPAGISRYHFSGERKIDFDVFVINSAGDLVGGQSLAQNSWLPSTEQGQYAATNNNAAFNEVQQVLRLKGGSGFDVVVVAYDKGQAPADLALSGSGSLTLTAHGQQHGLGQ